MPLFLFSRTDETFFWILGPPFHIIPQIMSYAMAIHLAIAPHHIMFSVVGDIIGSIGFKMSEKDFPLSL